MADLAPKLKKLLLAAQCQPLRPGKGDHEIWRSPRSPHPFSVDNKIKSRHTANAVLKAAGLPKQF